MTGAAVARPVSVPLPATATPSLRSAVAAHRSIGYRVESVDGYGATLRLSGPRVYTVACAVLWHASYAARATRVGAFLLRFAIARQPVVYIDANGNRA